MTVQLSGRQYVHADQGGRADRPQDEHGDDAHDRCHKNEAAEDDPSAAHEEETMTTSEPERTYGQSTAWKPEVRACGCSRSSSRGSPRASP